MLRLYLFLAACFAIGLATVAALALEWSLGLVVPRMLEAGLRLRALHRLDPLWL